ncbi:hypothetical protein HPG69_010869, partial [Diceros bicornis minor]
DSAALGGLKSIQPQNQGAIWGLVPGCGDPRRGREPVLSAGGHISVGQQDLNVLQGQEETAIFKLRTPPPPGYQPQRWRPGVIAHDRGGGGKGTHRGRGEAKRGVGGNGGAESWAGGPSSWKAGCTYGPSGKLRGALGHSLLLEKSNFSGAGGLRGDPRAEVHVGTALGTRRSGTGRRAPRCAFWEL